MDTWTRKIEEYETKKKQLDSLKQNIIECPRLYMGMARELCPDLFKDHTNEDEELVWLTEMIGKYGQAANVPTLPGAKVSGMIAHTIRDQANLAFFKTVQRIVDRCNKRKNELKKARRLSKK
jgi:hypothetical protein